MIRLAVSCAPGAKSAIYDCLVLFVKIMTHSGL